MDVATLHRGTVDHWMRAVEGVGPDDWTRATPCAGWTVRDLVNHVTGEELWTVPLVQGAYRVGDSCTNIVTPLNQYFPLILGFAARYVPNTGIGTMIAMMLPYSLAFLVAWTLMLIAWILAGLPVGPGAGLYLSPQ